MKHLIVNGDDFGASRGINRGIVEAHQKGILTSASMMVNRAASAEAAHLAGLHPNLSLGLHVVLPSPANPASVEMEVEGQLMRFLKLTGQLPTHIDAHHNVHRDARLSSAFVDVANRYRLPLRGHCGVRHIARFYGQRSGDTHLESISPTALERILATEIEDGFNELCCHPGYVGPDLVSSYSHEREAELETLCDRGVSALVRRRGIRLATFRDLSQP
jgi:predicted glycoside hydrolase/deacetylase ChbG (UPF0249 family)